MKKLLFICGKNRRRSPTAEQIFSQNSKFETASAGLNSDAEQPVTPELIWWADVIFVMELVPVTETTVFSLILLYTTESPITEY